MSRTGPSAAPAAAPHALDALSGAVVVVKFGGAVMRESALAEGWAAEVAELIARGVRPVVVHGGGPELSSLMSRLGIVSEFVEGHRVTSAEGVAAAEMVLSGRVNKRLVARLQGAGVPAVGLSGTDGALLRVRRYRPGGRDIGYVGTVDEVDTSLLRALLAAGYTPVISSTATDDEGRALNVNADLVAGAVAGALSAARLVFLTDVDGVAVDGERQRLLPAGRARSLLAAGIAHGGMRPKLEAGLAALEAGVAGVRLVNGSAARVLLDALEGRGEPGTLLLAAEDSP